MTAAYLRKMALAALLALSPAAALLAQKTSSTPKAPESEDEKLFYADASTYTATPEPYAKQWTPVREGDIFWRKRVHRTADAADPANAPLAGASGKSLAALLVEAAQAGVIKAYKTEMFAGELTAEEIKALTDSSGLITKFRIKEDWIYVRDNRELLGRIIGVAPAREVVSADGVVTEEPLFWIYYPELRPFLAQQKINRALATSKNLDQWFEARRFASYNVQTILQQAPGQRFPAPVKK